MHSIIESVRTSTHIPIKCCSRITYFITISHNKWVFALPTYWGYLNNWYETSQIVDVLLEIVLIFQWLQVEQLIIATSFILETFLVLFASLAQLLVVLKKINVCQHTHDIRKAMIVEQTQVLECLHLKSNTCINQY